MPCLILSLSPSNALLLSLILASIGSCSAQQKAYQATEPCRYMSGG